MTSTKRMGALTWRSRLLLAATLAVGVLAPVAAAAQPAGQQAEDPLREAARERYLNGRDLLESGNAVGALQEFAASYQLYANWPSLYGMAMCQEALERPAAALELYQQVLREGGDEVPGSERLTIGARITEIQAQIGTTPTTGSTGRLAVRSTPGGAAVLVDGAPAGTAPLQVDVSVGPHRIEAKLEGYETTTRWIDVVENQTATVEIGLVALGTQPVPGEEGFLIVRATPSGTVSVDDAAMGTTPTQELRVAAGTRRVRVVDDAGHVWEDDVEVAAGRTMVVDVRLGVSQGIDPLWFWLTAGTAGALAVGGAATGGYVLSLKDEYYDPATSPSRRDDIKSTGDPLRVVTDALFGAAGACAIGALALLFFTDFEGGGGAEADVRPLEETPSDAGTALRGTAEW